MTDQTLLVASMILALLALIFLFMLLKFQKESNALKKKYSKIIDIDEEFEKIKKEKENIDSEIQKLRLSFKDKKEIFNKLVREAAIYDQEIQLAELGFYKPNFDFDTSQEFKDKINDIKSEQKEMISDKTAIICNTEWSVEGSKAKGKAMTNRGIRLTARAFNNECDAAIANVKWNNVSRMEQRIIKAFEGINKLNASNNIFIETDYLDLKLDELRLTHEYSEKKQAEKEEQQEIKRQIREEEKLQKEIDNAQKEEDKYQKLMEKAKKEALSASGDALNKLNEKIALLEKELLEAEEKNQRAKSMAQQTKSGHVYIISNIGSFGENVYKIGLTRRLEPADRVKELGDASVPFIFDIHAMIFSKNAPELEKKLHHVFHEKRVNLINHRKEFFKVSLEEIKNEVSEKFPDCDFVKLAEARDYRESLALSHQLSNQADASEIIDSFPDEI